jgi:23S rRNA pseudouridine1911/1915/1917 synthase
MKNQVLRFLIQPGDAGQRVDQVLPRYAASLSRTRLRKLIDIGAVHLAGRRLSQCSRKVETGQAVEIFIDGLPLVSWSLSESAIIYQDRYLLVLNKPAGIDTQPTPSRFKGTVYYALQKYLEPRQGVNQVTLGMVQRLDRGTSGVMIFSIHPSTHKGLTEAFSQRQADKRYLALVAGELPDDQGEFRSLLARNRATNLVKSVERGGKEAITRFRVLTRRTGTTLVEVELLTGRTHQIRAHFSEQGYPLLGDVRYGGPESLAGYRFGHPLLHSRQLGLHHPVSREELRFVASLPDDWSLFWKQLGADPFGLNHLIETARV